MNLLGCFIVVLQKFSINRCKPPPRKHNRIRRGDIIVQCVLLVYNRQTNILVGQYIAIEIICRNNHASNAPYVCSSYPY